MASNATVYKDQTPAAALDKATLNKMVWRSLMLQASFNYERMQAAGWEYTILPGLEKIHTNKGFIRVLATYEKCKTIVGKVYTEKEFEKYITSL